MERMDEFFAARVNGYDEHMMNEVEGCRECYEMLPGLLPQNAKALLDLGCGTGLELRGIFKRFPDISVTGIDMTKEMLDRLSEKYQGKNITLINGNYFETELGQNRFDAAVSVETMHHFSHEMKLGLYKKIYASLKSGGAYTECDYTTETQEEEDRLFSENKRIRREMNIPEEEIYHFDTPCTVENQIRLLAAAGFRDVQKVFGVGGTAIITAKKEG